MPNVEIRDADGKLLHTYKIIADGIGNLITTEHLFEMAKMNAIEDELVSEDRADELTFSVVG
ncbi:MAG: hypothetical protein HN719_06405 [Alphaproteobacteria bacterium]|nr:hypothetical protein [Alphaproteobacteria bacterium]